MLVVFRDDKPNKVRKVGPPGRPELWFFLGAVAGSGLKADTISATKVAPFMDRSEAAYFAPPLHLGPPGSLYSAEADGLSWRVATLGIELGEIEGPDTLAEKVLGPLTALQ